MNLSENIYTRAFEQYRKMGLDPLPIPYDEDGHPTKKPKIDDWPTKAANGDFTVADFATPCNIGNCLGGPKNVTDLDCDSAEAVVIGGEIMGDLMETTGETMMFGRDSCPRSHYIHYCDKSLPSEKVNDPVDGECIIEYRCVTEDGTRGKQTVFPPSLWYDPDTGQTEQIRFEDNSAIEPVFVESAKLYRRFRTIAATALLAKHFPGKGQRHDAILALAGLFARTGMEIEKALTLVDLAYQHSKDYNNDSKKAGDEVRSVYKTFAKDSAAHLYGYPKLTEFMPRPVVDMALELLGIEKQAIEYHLTDAGNGLRLVDKHKDHIRYCVDERSFYFWDDVRWRKDEVRNIRELAKGIASDIRSQAHAMKPPLSSGDKALDDAAMSRHDAAKRELLKWANTSENADRVSKTILSAESDSRITCFRSDFDRQPELLNCTNCIVNLHTGQAVPHDRTLMLSYLCPIEYDPLATHPVWDESLAAFTRHHPDLPPFLRRVTGYSIQGSKTEERILILHGNGNAGKGTYMDWLANALGPDYACAMDANSVLKQKRDSAAASGDLARLEGKRLVVVSEIEKGSRLQESWMKQASGNDSLVARGLYQSEREFRPTHQFWFQSNYRPGFDSTDSGNRRRYVEIPFDNDLSADDRVTFDPGLKVRMREDRDFLKAVLAWAVAGAVEWKRDGLQIPESVNAATDALFAHNDFLSDFLADMCMGDPDEKVFVKDLSVAYQRWCEDQGEEPAQGRTFNHMLEERGFQRRQATINRINKKAWSGIRLKTPLELNVDTNDTASEQSETGAHASGRDRSHRLIVA